MPYDTNWITDPILNRSSTVTVRPVLGSPKPSPTPREAGSRTIWAVVPARKGSRGVPDKNIRPLGSSSLLDRAIRVGEQLQAKIVVTTDYPSDLVRVPAHALLLPRPPHLATHDASMWEVLMDLGQTLHWERDDLIVLLQPTSLHRDRARIVATIMRDGAVPSVTVERFPERWHPWYALTPKGPHNVPTSRHDLPERFRPNGLAYLMSGELARRGTFWAAHPTFYEVPDVTNVDTPEDWKEAVQRYGHL